VNKAFVKEPEEHGDRCPSCDSVGRQVFQVTLRSHLAEEESARFRDSAYFCPLPTCEVAYFDKLERTVSTDCLQRPVYPKDPSAAICPCFGLTCDDIEADVAEGGVTRLKAHRQQADSPEASCAKLSPDGQSCIGVVQRYFMRARGM